ncbi:PIF1-like helicase domain-containing protein [Ditylenchus destructor]|uniref:ATP-dependent DNA helicase n=1 Tax=Ditylenchus destructor TaxID=166010 RepID=A0AAD4NF08_9BILA|nr:PIF1-like helicase domain-containing protein [Ditylenchus destructor]
MHKEREPMCYPVFYPTAQGGWTPEMNATPSPPESPNKKEIWEVYKELLSEDFIKDKEGRYTLEQAIELAKMDIQNQLLEAGKTLEDIKEIFVLAENVTFEKPQYDEKIETEQFSVMYSTMTESQKRVVHRVKEMLIDYKNGSLANGALCIDGPGGSGKTYTYTALCHYFRSTGINYKTSSWMGIAANLLPDGTTVHRTLGLPLNMDDYSTCRAKINNKLGQELKGTDVLIIDEISMVPKRVMKEIDRVLKELMENENVFGGKIVIIGGDFRQCLPVEKKVPKSVIISSSVRRSELWPYFEENLFHLEGNKKVHSDQQEFAEFILNMGNGVLPTDEEEFIEIPSKCILKVSCSDEVDIGEKEKDNEAEPEEQHPKNVSMFWQKPKKPKRKAEREDKVVAIRKKLVDHKFEELIATGLLSGVSANMNSELPSVPTRGLSELARWGHLGSCRNGGALGVPRTLQSLWRAGDTSGPAERALEWLLSCASVICNHDN